MTQLKILRKKTSDWDDIDIVTVKNVTDGIAKPLTYIFYLYFQNGIFQHKMKVAKVVPTKQAINYTSLSTWKSTGDNRTLPVFQNTIKVSIK